ncbi:hypothetical protein [Pseudonocardia spirodelae]|uniref:DUF2306 domain-containing protein n=1 Tax=Pseudonocardia spirodelae TaxID=3133431 RepID=A0ABU8T682_9PSEU
MQTYDPLSVFGAVERNVVAVVLLVAVCGVATLTYLISAFRAASRTRLYPAAFTAVGFFGVHDLTYVLNWPAWLSGPLSHPWTILWLAGLAVTTVIEFALVAQVFRFGRSELMPWASQRLFGALLLAGIGGIAVAWVVVKSALHDPLFLISFAVTAWMGPVFESVLLTRRRSSAGQTMTMAWSLVAVQVGLFTAWALLDAFFRSPIFLAFGGSAVVWAVANVALLRRAGPGTRRLEG